jgi:hypothetical protein
MTKVRNDTFPHHSTHRQAPQWTFHNTPLRHTPLLRPIEAHHAHIQ